LSKRNSVPDGNLPKSDLMYIIKGDTASKLGNMIDILDEMHINGVPSGHYADVDISDTEAGLIKKTEEANGIK
jgi:hypothetical protein